MDSIVTTVLHRNASSGPEPSLATQRRLAIFIPYQHTRPQPCNLCLVPKAYLSPHLFTHAGAGRSYGHVSSSGATMSGTDVVCGLSKKSNRACLRPVSQVGSFFSGREGISLSICHPVLVPLHAFEQSDRRRSFAPALEDSRGSLGLWLCRVPFCLSFVLFPLDFLLC